MSLKRFFVFVLCILMAVGVFSGCAGSNAAGTTEATKPTKPSEMTVLEFADTVMKALSEENIEVCMDMAHEKYLNYRLHESNSSREDQIQGAKILFSEENIWKEYEFDSIAELGTADFNAFKENYEKCGLEIEEAYIVTYNLFRPTHEDDEVGDEEWLCIVRIDGKLYFAAIKMF